VSEDEDLYRQTLKQYDDPLYAKQYASNIEDRIDEWIFDEFLPYLQPHSTILDVACAAGRDSNYLDSKGYKVTGVDISGGLINIAQQKYPKIKFLKADFTKLPLKDNSFDGVWCKAALVHLPSQESVKEALEEFSRVLKPNGYIMVRTKVRAENKPETEFKQDPLSGKKRYFRYQDYNKFLSLCEDKGYKIIKGGVHNEKEGQQYSVMRDENWLFIIAQKAKEI
jgi:ubiquinone/menaquinone biosynthesis C-methylase UbiE